MHVFMCVCVCVCVCARARCNRIMYAHENTSCLSQLLCVCVCKQLQDKLLENEVFGCNLETMRANGNEMKQTFEEAHQLVEEARDSIGKLKREAFGGEDGQEEEEEGGGEEGREEVGDGSKSEQYGRNLHECRY